jgi:hypothetical protein
MLLTGLQGFSADFKEQRIFPGEIYASFKPMKKISAPH